MCVLSPEDYERFVREYRLSRRVTTLLARLRVGVAPLDIPAHFNDTTNRRAKRLLTHHLRTAERLADETVRFLLRQRKRRHDRLRKRTDRARYEFTARALAADLENTLAAGDMALLDASLRRYDAEDKCVRQAVPALAALAQRARAALRHRPCT